MLQVIEKLFPRISKDLKSKMISELELWPIKEPLLGDPNSVIQPDKNSIKISTAVKNSTDNNRQGQVTKETKLNTHTKGNL